MLNNPTLDKLITLRLQGMAEAYQEQINQNDIDRFSFDERFALLVDRQALYLENRRLKSRLRKARFKQPATMEDIDYRHPRGLNKSLLMDLASGQWIKRHQNVLIVGPTGTGKTYLACALAHKACLIGHTACYTRLPRLMPALELAKGDGSHLKKMKDLEKIQVLILDDWGLMTLKSSHRRDLLEILDDRHDCLSTIVTSQLPIQHWHESIGDNTLADAILDRLVHNAHTITMKGDSMRKLKNKSNQKETV